MESIREIFKDKGFSEEELNYLENAINEFQVVFGDYVSREDLIERVKRNVDTIEFIEKLDNTTCVAIGCYCLKDKKIQVINGLEESKAKSVFFHEFVHAIAKEGENTGFDRSYVDYDGESVDIGTGFNEGFVQMMTQERDRKVANKVITTGYPILTADVNKFCDLYGKNELINLYCNQPDEFINYMIEKSDSFSLDFLYNFDVIHKYENEIIKRKIYSQSHFFEFFGKQVDQKVCNEELINAQEDIIQIYLDEILKEKIESSVALEDTLKQINDVYSIFSKTISSYTLHRLLEQTNPEVLNELSVLDYDSKVLIDSQLLFEKFQKLSTTDKLTTLMDIDNEFVNGLYSNLVYKDESLMREYFSLMTSELYENYKNFQNQDMFLWMSSFSSVAKYILENDLSFENLKIVYNEYLGYDNVFEVYNFQGGSEYEKVATLVVDDDDVNTIEYTEIGSKEWGELNERIQGENYGNLIEAVGDKKGNFVAYCEDGQVFVSTEYDEIVKPDDTISIESVNELKLKSLEQHITNRTTRLENLLEMSAPDIIIQNESEILEGYKREKREVIGLIRSATREKIIPAQIEAKTINGNVTVQSLQSTMKALATEDKNIENEGGELNVE